MGRQPRLWPAGAGLIIARQESGRQAQRPRETRLPVSAGRILRNASAGALLAWTLLLGGCPPPAPAPSDVPYPINLTLPKTIRLHPFTGTRVFDDAGGTRGIDVRVEALDHYGDSTKAFGRFRFELYEFLPRSADPKGRRLSAWDIDLNDPRANFVHWDGITRTYQFKLQWGRGIPVGERFVLVAVFVSGHTDLLEDERTFVSGQ